MSAAAYQTEFNNDVAAGYRLKHVSGYGGAGGEEFAAIFEKTSGPAWVAHHAMTAAQYQQQFNAQLQAGYHLVLVGGYPAGNDVHYVAIWEQGAVVPWQARHGLSASDYQQTFSDLRYQGYRPVVVSGYSLNGAAEYAALWQNYSFSAADLNAIDTQVNKTMSAIGAPGLSLAITQGGRLVFAKAYGYADPTAKTPTNTSNLFRIASVSKAFTSTAILELYANNKLGLDDKVFGPGKLLGTTYGTQPYSKWLQEITVRHLLTHTAGGWPNDSTDPMFKNTSMTTAQLISWTLDNYALQNEPGTAYAYSNFGYCLLGRIIEKVTGQSYDAWVKANVLAQSGISDMQIAGNTLAQRAANEVVYGDSSSSAYQMNVTRMDSHGGWIATPIDLVRFGVRIDGLASPPDLLSSANLDLQTTPTAASITAGNPYGMGRAIHSSPGSSTISPIPTQNTWWHNGLLDGTTSINVRTASGFTWAAVINSRDDSVNIDPMMWNVVTAVSTWPSYDLFVNL
jgi:CubicO group peptidase (beta-lactamase class C family)